MLKSQQKCGDVGKSFEPQNIVIQWSPLNGAPSGIAKPALKGFALFLLCFIYDCFTSCFVALHNKAALKSDGLLY